MLRFTAHLIPGTLLIARGRILTGMSLSLMFAVLANVSVVAWAILPAEFSSGLRIAVVLLVGLTYFLAVVLGKKAAIPQGGAAKFPAPALSNSARRNALSALLQAIEDGSIADEAFEELQGLGQSDLHVAHRLAQYAELVAHENTEKYWKKLRELDRHGVYSARRPVL